jgi:hypothetical protein
VRSSRTITTQNGITGGGDLTANRTIGLTGNALGVHNLTANGFVARTGDGTMAARTLGQGTGIAITNADGVAGNPTIALTGLTAAIQGIATNGIVVRTGATTAVSRTLAQGEGIAITNGDGVAGNPTFALSGNALSLSTLATNGFVARTAAGTVAARTLTQGTGITIANGDGVAGSPTITFSGDIATTGVTAGLDNDGEFTTGTTYTPTPVGGNFKSIVNSGAFTIAAPTVAGNYTLIIHVLNSATAGAITMSTATGFNRVMGDAFTATPTHHFFIFITRCNNRITAVVQAHQ